MHPLNTQTCYEQQSNMLYDVICCKCCLNGWILNTSCSRRKLSVFNIFHANFFEKITEKLHLLQKHAGSVLALDLGSEIELLQLWSLLAGIIKHKA